MRSSTGQHYAALDHVRAVAAFLVFSWHFIHSWNGYPVRFNTAPELGIIDEGSTGVALFMVLSGYLFAKLLNGKNIIFASFLWNRCIRLFPLLLVVFTLIGLRLIVIDKSPPLKYITTLLSGFITPVWPNGGWSIAVELHFYLILPLLLTLKKRSPKYLLVIVAAAIVARSALFVYLGQIEDLSYWTIVGRIDQFVLGIFAFESRDSIAQSRLSLPVAFIIIYLFYAAFDWAGGFYNHGSYPSHSPVWIVLPTIEGAAYAVIIAAYDAWYRPRGSAVEKILQRAGAYSYSIYLLHFFVVFRLAHLIDTHVMRLSNFYVALAWSLASFMLMIPVGYLSFRFIEEPFLRLRRNYIAVPDAARRASPATT